MEIPHDHRATKAFHSFLVSEHLAEVHHVVIPASEGGCQHTIEVRLHAYIVAILCPSWHPIRLDIFPFVVVFNHTSFATVVLIIRKSGNKHPSRERIKSVRSNDPTRILYECVDGF